MLLRWRGCEWRGCETLPWEVRGSLATVCPTVSTLGVSGLQYCRCNLGALGAMHRLPLQPQRHLSFETLDNASLILVRHALKESLPEQAAWNRSRTARGANNVRISILCAVYKVQCHLRVRFPDTSRSSYRTALPCQRHVETVGPPSRLSTLYLTAWTRSTCFLPSGGTVGYLL